MYSRNVFRLSILLLLAGMVGYSANGAVAKVDPSLSGWWKFDEGKGVTAIENAYKVAPQHVLSDEELIPSVIKFATDGSEVLIIYQADRSLPLYPDCARKGREGARGILNAFELIQIETK